MLLYAVVTSVLSSPLITMQLDYSDAQEALMQAVRKAPASAVGFRIAATKLACVVQVRWLQGQ
jgi:hypothetical protein